MLDITKIKTFTESDVVDENNFSIINQSCSKWIEF